MRKLLITGAAGFVGHHFVDHFLKTTNFQIAVLDSLSYASTLSRLRDIGAIGNKRVSVLTADLSKPIPDGLRRELADVDAIFHLAAESHVDRSISDPSSFVRANVLGTAHLLDFAKNIEIERFYYFSTDEVFGPAPDGFNFKEDDVHRPGNPYAATKSGAESLCMAYANTYKIPMTITRCMNIFGPRQHPEKFIPKVIKSVLTGDQVTIHATPDKSRAGSRFYIHARSVASAYGFLLGKPEGIYHIVGEREVDNLTLAKLIAGFIGKPLKWELVDFHSSRPGHDLRYALDGGKMAGLGWKPENSFESSLEETVKWYLENPQWMN